MGKVQKAALVYLLVILFFFYGYAVARFQVPPYAFLESRVKEIQDFTSGEALDENTTIVDKIKSDTGILPKRFLSDHPAGLNTQEYSPLSVPGLRSKRALPLVSVSEEHREGYRFIVGAMDFKETFWGAILIGPHGDVVNTWHLTTNHLPGNSRYDRLKVLYGSHIGRDGSIIFSMQQDAGGLVKVDACSRELWNVPGEYHHTVSSDGKGAFWTYVGVQETFDQDMQKISEETGEILQTIDMAEVREANDDVYIWNLRNPHSGDMKRQRNSDHMTHGNDIDPLPEHRSASFPQFEVGDLVISYASTNLVFVLDPDTLAVKWWRVGITDYQHDPDWEPDGRISIFNNKPRRQRYDEKYSNIVAIDPDTYESEVTYYSEEPLFLSLYNGRHELTDFNTRMITSSTQGWAFEVDEGGEIVFSLLNSYDEQSSLFLSNALRLPADYFDGRPWEECEGNAQ